MTTAGMEALPGWMTSVVCARAAAPGCADAVSGRACGRGGGGAEVVRAASDCGRERRPRPRPESTGKVAQLLQLARWRHGISNQVACFGTWVACLATGELAAELARFWRALDEVAGLAPARHVHVILLMHHPGGASDITGCGCDMYCCAAYVSLTNMVYCCMCTIRDLSTKSILIVRFAVEVWNPNLKGRLWTRDPRDRSLPRCPAIAELERYGHQFLPALRSARRPPSPRSHPPPSFPLTPSRLPAMSDDEQHNQTFEQVRPSHLAAAPASSAAKRALTAPSGVGRRVGDVPDAVLGPPQERARRH
jgi:hypothetical protein